MREHRLPSAEFSPRAISPLGGYRTHVKRPQETILHRKLLGLIHINVIETWNKKPVKVMTIKMMYQPSIMRVCYFLTSSCSLELHTVSELDGNYSISLFSTTCKCH